MRVAVSSVAAGVGRTDAHRRTWTGRAATATCGFAVLVSVALTISASKEGQDFSIGVWAPARALWHGIDPFSGRVAVPGIDHDHVAAPLYAPFVYLLHAPLILLSNHAGRVVSEGLCLVLLWVAVLLLVRPTTTRGWLVAAAVGTVTARTMMVEAIVLLGQYTTWQLFGFALAVWATRAKRPWLVAAGFAVAVGKPQTAVPVAIALLLLGQWRTVARTAALAGVASLPGLVLMTRAAGGVGHLARSLSDNYRIFNHLPWNELASSKNTRADVLGVVTHLGGPALDGAAWAGLTLVLATVLAALVLVPARRRLGERALLDARVWWVVTGLVVLPLYHQPYDLLFAVVPITLTAVAWSDLDRRDRGLLGLPPAAFLVVEVAGHLHFQQRLATLLGASEHTISQAFLIVPTLVLVVCVLAGGLSHPPQPIENRVKETR